MNELQNTQSGIKINSLYVLKEIFSFLSEKQKLYAIIYNKQLQNQFNANIENYKRVRGVYKEIGKNGKIKEYIISNKKLIFEGEYLNGKKMVKEKNIIILVR